MILVQTTHHIGSSRIYLKSKRRNKTKKNHRQTPLKQQITDTDKIETNNMNIKTNPWCNNIEMLNQNTSHHGMPSKDNIT
jgi:hypothetical protein